MSSKGSHKSFYGGVLCTLLGGSLWGFSGTSVQFLTTTGGAEPAFVTMLRTFLGGVIVVGYLCIANRRVLTRMFADSKALIALAAFAAALYANQFCYAETVQITNAGTATVLQMLGTVFVMAYMCMRISRLPRIREACGLIIALVATFLIATHGNVGSLHIPIEGLVWGVLTGLSTAAYILIPKQLGLFDRFGAVPVVGVGMLMGSLIGIPVYAACGGSAASFLATAGSFTLGDWMIFSVGLVLCGTIGGYGFYLHGVSIVGPVKGSLLGAIEPVSATVLAALWLGTTFTLPDIVGMLLMCVMVVLVSNADADDAARVDAAVRMDADTVHTAADDK